MIGVKHYDFIFTNIMFKEFIAILNPRKTVRIFSDYVESVYREGRFERTHIYIAYLFIFYECFHRLYLYFIPINECTFRKLLLHFDYMIILFPEKRSPEIFEIMIGLNIAFSMRIYYFQYQGKHFRYYYYYMYDILINQNLSSFYSCYYQNKLVSELIQRAFKITVNLCQVFVFNIMLMSAHAYKIMLFKLLAFDQLILFWEYLSFNWHMFTHVFLVLYCAHFYILSIVVSNLFLFIFYIQTKQIDSLLMLVVTKQHKFNKIIFERYRHLKMKLLVNFEHGNQCSNGHFNYFLLANVPINAVVLIWIMLEHIKWPSTLFAGSIVTYQLIIIIVFHYVLTTPAQINHKPAKMLLKFAATKDFHAFSHKTRNNRPSISKYFYHISSMFRSTIHLEQLINILHTKKLLGMTYGKYGLVTLATFSKVIRREKK